MKPKIDVSLVAPRPYTVEETPNGTYLRAANGLRCAIVLGLPEHRSATAQYISQMINGAWVNVIREGKDLDEVAEIQD